MTLETCGTPVQNVQKIRYHTRICIILAQMPCNPPKQVVVRKIKMDLFWKCAFLLSLKKDVT